MTTKSCIDHAVSPCSDGGIHAKERCDTHYRRALRASPKCRYTGCGKSPFKEGYCRPHEREALTRNIPEYVQLDRLAKFRGDVRPNSVTGCWLWAGPTNEEGYAVTRSPTGWYAHRFAYVWFYGGHGQRQELDHVCNTPLCVRPDHLEPVSRTINERRKHERALSGRVDHWRDSARLPRSLELLRWASEVGLPPAATAMPQWQRWAA